MSTKKITSCLATNRSEQLEQIARTQLIYSWLAQQFYAGELWS
jgi:hypothetical protein